MRAISNEVKTEVLIQALPYIQRYQNKIVVIKYGGSEDMDEVMRDITLLWHIGVKTVLVHGSNSLDDAREFVAALGRHGGKAIGLSGSDGGLFSVLENGEVDEIDPDVVTDVISMGYIPVIAAACGGTATVSPDEVAAKLAGALKAEIIISMTDVCGILRDMTDETTLIPEISLSEVPLLLRQGVIDGPMAEKVGHLVDAVRRGVKKAFIIDGRVPHSVLTEMFSDEGVGTMLV